MQDNWGYAEFIFKMAKRQGRIQLVSLGGDFSNIFSVIFCSEVSLGVHYCKRHKIYFTTLLWQNKGRQNDLITRILFPALYIIMVKKVAFVGFRRGRSRPWIHPCQETCRLNLEKLETLENDLALPTNIQLTCSAEQLNTSRACLRNILCNETALWGKDQEVKGFATFNDSTVDHAHLCPWEWRKFIPRSGARGCQGGTIRFPGRRITTGAYCF